MAQVQPTTPSVTSKQGTVYENRPVNLDNILRFTCDVSTYIGDKDLTRYPAIKFDIADTKKGIQYWIYPDSASRDQDCEMLINMTNVPESDFLAYWDVTGDNLPDLDPTAIFVGGASGTHQADQLYFDQTGVPNPLPVPFDGIIEVRRLGTPYVLGNFDASNGSSLANVANWSGPFASDLAANFVGTIGHTNLMQFAKLSFALTFGQTYGKAAPITMRIKTRKGGLLSGNTGNLLTLGVNETVGQLEFPNDMDITNFGLKEGKVLHVGLSGSENTLNQGVQDIQITTQRWSKKRMDSDVQNISLRATHCRYYDDLNSPTGRSCIFAKNSDRTKLWRIHIIGFDSDNFPIYDANALDVNGTGNAGAAPTGPSQFAVSQTLTANRMPVILLTKGTTTGLSCSILVNSTNDVNPDYGTFLNTNAIDATLVLMVRPRQDSVGRFYTRHGSGNGFFSRLVFNGTNNNAASLLDSANWSRQNIAVPVATTPALNGTGATLQASFDGCAVNEDLIVNGEPTIYVSDGTNSVIWQAQRNANSFGDERDWDWTIIIGQSGVPGNTDGFGTGATISQPRSLVHDDGFLYIASRTGHTVRRYNVATTEVETYFGIAGSLGSTQQLSY